MIAKLNPIPLVDSSNVEIGVPEPNWVIAASIQDEQEYTLDTYQNVRYLLVDEQFYVDATYYTIYKRTIRQLLTMQAVEDHSSILIDFHPQLHKLAIHHIFIHRENFKIDICNQAEYRILKRERKAENHIYEGDLTLSIFLNNIQANDKLELIYSLTNHDVDNNRFHNRLISLEYNVPVFQMHYACITTNNKPISFKFLQKEYPYELIQDSDKHIFTLNINNINAVKNIAHLPYWYLEISYLQIGVLSTWNEINVEESVRYHANSINHPTLKRLIADIENAKLTNDEIIIEVLKFINNKIRYFADTETTGFMKPSSPDETIERMYGDCKAIVNLFHAILTHFDIESYPVLVHSSLSKILDKFNPAVNFFNHVILLIKLDNAEYFIDPTAKQNISSLNYLYMRNLGYGLVLNSSSTNLVLIKNNVGCNNVATINDQIEIISLKENKIKITSTVKLEGWLALNTLSILEKGPKTDFLENIKRQYDKVFIINQVIKSEIDYSEIDKNSLSISIEYDASAKFITKDSKQTMVQFVATSLTDYLDLNLPKKVEGDFYFGTSFEVEYALTILGKNHNPSRADSRSISNDAFYFSVSCSNKKGKSCVNYQYKKLAEVVPNSNYQKFYDDIHKIDNLLIVNYRRKNNKSLIYKVLVVGVLIALVLKASIDDFAKQRLTQTKENYSYASLLSDPLKVKKNLAVNLPE